MWKVETTTADGRQGSESVATKAAAERTKQTIERTWGTDKVRKVEIRECRG